MRLGENQHRRIVANVPGASEGPAANPWPQLLWPAHTVAGFVDSFKPVRTCSSMMQAIDSKDIFPREAYDVQWLRLWVSSAMPVKSKYGVSSVHRSMTTAETIASITAVLGLVIAVLSALAAFRSASSARTAQRWAEESAHTAATLSASRTATEVLVETQRIKSLSDQALLAYRTLEVFSGSFQNSGIQETQAKVRGLASRAEELGASARLFTDTAVKLKVVPLEEVARVQLQLSSIRAQVVAVRGELEQMLAVVEEQNTQYRERALSR